MISKNNLKELNELEQEYILGIKMRQLDQEKKKKLLGLRGIKELRKNLYVKEVFIEGEGRYIVCYNPFEAKRQREKRREFKKYLRKKVNTATLKEWVIKNGYKKYVDFEGSVTVNEQKIKDESQYDGKWILLTNTNLPQKEVALQYKGLWEIEAGFRDLKQDLDTSPIYHWKERRIVSHVFVCFLALLIKIAFEKKLKALDKNVDYVDVWQAIKQIKAVKISSGPQEIIFRTEFPEKAHWAFKALSLAPPPRILSYNKAKRSVPSQATEPYIDDKLLFQEV
jgi:transposase